MWIAITEAHLLTRLSGGELAAFRAASLASGQADPVAETILATVGLARGFIPARASNRNGPANTIPKNLLGPCLSLIVLEVETRCAGKLMDPQGARQKAADTAMSVLRDVAAGRFAIEVPEEVSAEKVADFTPSISNAVGNAWRLEQQGL